MTRNPVPLRHSLLTRLLVTSVLIAIASVAATAWLAARTTSRAITQEQGRSLAEDKAVYDLLLGFAATHTDWSGVQAALTGRKTTLDRRVTLMTPDRVVLADTAAGPSLRATRPSAVVNPLDVDLGLTGGSDRIDPRAVGPFRVPAAERAPILAAAEAELACLRQSGRNGRIENQPNGRPAVVLTTADPGQIVVDCRPDPVASPTEDKALRKLADRSARCAGLTDRRLTIEPDFTVFSFPKQERPMPATTVPDWVAPVDSGPNGSKIVTCVADSRRDMIQPYVAPPVLLFVTDPDTGQAPSTFSLSRANVIRIVTVAGAVLLATILASVLVGRRLVRPLRALTEAAERQTSVVVPSRDEIGVLARALTGSAERRDRAEAQRRAMVGDVAHELRTPLSNIRSWLEAAQDGLAPTDPALLTLLHEEAVLLQHIIDDLSDLAAADSGTLRVHPEPTYVRDVLGQVVDGHQTAAGAAGVRLVTEVDGDPVLTVDAVRLRQIVGNLVSNAIRHTPRDGTVTVSAQEATISVRDTGEGISAEDLPKVFDRFWRADQSRSRSTGGSGLGLSIARQLAEAHGGTIEVRSVPGRGAAFTVRLTP